jgi:hypothetical protein
MKCCLCDKEITQGFGNSPWPIKNGHGESCCDECMNTKVREARKMLRYVTCPNCGEKVSVIGNLKN